MNMLARQKLGAVVMIMFLPINGPLWRMAMESLGTPIPLGELQFMLLSLGMFSIGAVMLMAPKLRFPSDSIK